jgi:hypothetical protein
MNTVSGREEFAERVSPHLTAKLRVLLEVAG